jgi:hypothetical protein
VLELLKKLPQNLQMEQTIKSQAVPWHKLFKESTPRVTYWLSIIFTLAHRDMGWYDRFRLTGGVSALYEFFLGMGVKPLECETVFTVLDVLNHMRVL